MADDMKAGMRLYRTGKYEEALAAFLGISAGDSPSNHELAYYIGLCYARLERWDDALLYLEQVVTADTDLARVYQCRMVLAVIYALTGRTRLADFELRKLLDAGYESSQVFCSLGYLAYESGDVETAVDWYEKALELDGANGTALNGLGYVLGDSGRDLTRAITMCRKATDAQPDNPAYLDSIGWVYHKLGFATEAKTYARRAREKAPGNSIILEHLNQILQGGR
jgi:tetratricopeptide (TPR) repeat protein